MLAKRLPSILPPMTLHEALETTKIHSVVGRIGTQKGLIAQRRFDRPNIQFQMSPSLAVGVIRNLGRFHYLTTAYCF